MNLFIFVIFISFQDTQSTLLFIKYYKQGQLVLTSAVSSKANAANRCSKPLLESTIEF